MDLELHPARIDRRNKVTHQAPLKSLPDGCFVQIEGQPYLVWGDALLLWTPEGYTRRDARLDSMVMVLTPEPMVACMRHGYRTLIHESSRC